MLPFLTFRIMADTSGEKISHLWHNPANLRELHHLPTATLGFWDVSLIAPPVTPWYVNSPIRKT